MEFTRDKRYLRAKKLVGQTVVKLLIFILLCGFAYIILYPFLFKILSSFMSKDDLYNSLVNLIPINWTFDTYIGILKETNFLRSLLNTFLNSAVCALLATFSAALIGYGLAKFKFKGSGFLMFMVVFTMLIPIYTLKIPIYTSFRFFDIFGLFEMIAGKTPNLLDTVWPSIMMAACGLSFRAGIFIVLMRQYYKGIPNELIEASYIDGAGPYATFFEIIIPMAKSMLVVIFSLSFAWQWTDTYYTGLLTPNLERLSNLISNMFTVNGQAGNYYEVIVRSNTAAIMAILPLVILYCFLQRNIIQGIEQSGLVG